MIELTSAAAQQILASAGHHGEGYALRIAAWPPRTARWSTAWASIKSARATSR